VGWLWPQYPSRAGKHAKARRHCFAYSETSDGEIPVQLTTCRRRCNSSAGRVGGHDRRDVVLRHVTTDKAVSSVDFQPSIYVINAAAITKLHAVQQLSSDIKSDNVDIARSPRHT